MNPNLSTPRIVLYLGYGGLLPFIGLALISLTNILPRQFVEPAIFDYAATILSFVAALHWGFAMTLQSLSEKEQSKRYIWSVIPPLLAWISLFMNPVICSAILIIGFITHLRQDLGLNQLKEVNLPSWYMPLRIRLTSIAVLSLLVVSISS